VRTWSIEKFRVNSQLGDHNGLDVVHPVFSLVEDEGMTISSLQAANMYTGKLIISPGIFSKIHRGNGLLNG